MSIPSDFDPLAWGERRYIQPVLKQGGSTSVWHPWEHGVTDENYPHSFKMEVGGTADNGAYVWKLFNGGWGSYNAPKDFYAILYPEKPLRIVGLSIKVSMHRGTVHKLYGIP